MSSVVADTHTIIWYLEASNQLSDEAILALDKAIEDGNFIYISAITLVEIIYLVEKYRLPQTALDQLNQALSDPDIALSLVPLDAVIAQTLSQIPRDTVPDMPDRIIAATALFLNLPLITRDSRIQTLKNIETIW